MHQKTVLALKLAALLGANLFLANGAHSVTIDAGDYTRLPDGTNLAVLYYQHFEGKQLYSQGNKLSGNARLSADVGILRGVRFVDIGDFTVVPQFLLPFGQLNTGGDLSGASSTNGIGDLIFAPTIHLIKDPERKRAFAVTPWLYMPTGNYDRNNALNAFGENRWNSFKQFRGYTPMAFLREQRLQGIRKALMSAPPGSTVVTIANLWGYSSLGVFAAAYFKRFGEYPSMTLNRLRTC